MDFRFLKTVIHVRQPADHLIYVYAMITTMFRKKVPYGLLNCVAWVVSIFLILYFACQLKHVEKIHLSK